MTLRRLHWSLYFLFWTAVIAAAGALLGAALFLVAGLAFSTGHTPGQLVQSGAGVGGFYAGMWAPGTAVVLCAMRAYRRRHPNAT